MLWRPKLVSIWFCVISVTVHRYTTWQVFPDTSVFAIIHVHMWPSIRGSLSTVGVRSLPSARCPFWRVEWVALIMGLNSLWKTISMRKSPFYVKHTLFVKDTLYVKGCERHSLCERRTLRERQSPHERPTLCDLQALLLGATLSVWTHTFFLKCFTDHAKWFSELVWTSKGVSKHWYFFVVFPLWKNMCFRKTITFLIATPAQRKPSVPRLNA